MDSRELKGILVFIGFILIAGLLLLGFLLFALILAVLAALLFFGFYAYLRVKLWWRKRHPPKILEGLEDYF